MPQKFLSIKNLEKYQTNRNTNPPWFKIHRLMFGDPSFIKLTPSQRFLYIGLIHLAVESGNRIYNDSTFIGQRLYIHHTEVDLKPLYRAGFLYTTNLSRVLSEREESRERAEGEPLPGERVSIEQKSNGKTTIQEGWILSEEVSVGWRKLGLNPTIEFATFKDHAKTNDRRCKDWEAAFRNWCRKSLAQKEKRP